MSKVTRLDDARPKCPYCGTAPTDEHPDYTCPRISAVTMDEGGYTIEYVSLPDWKAHLESLDAEPEKP